MPSESTAPPADAKADAEKIAADVNGDDDD